MANKEKKLRVRFCLGCKSFNVQYMHGLKNLFGIMPRQQCLDCKLETSIMPILEITQKELEKKKNTTKNKKMNKTKKQNTTKTKQKNKKK